MRKNKISVVICVYNGGKYISDCVESVLKNLESADELVIVNDGSNDNTESELKKFSSRFNIKIISYKKNKGLAAARNEGWQSASNDIIFYIDSDVEMPESALNVLDKFFSEEYSECSGITGRAVETGIITDFDIWRKEFFTQTQGDKILRNPPYFSGLCMAIKKKCLEELNGFSEEFISHSEDVEIALRLKKFGGVFYYIPDLFVYHKRTDNEHSLGKMVFNHIYWSIKAQQKYGISCFMKYFLASFKIIFKQLFITAKLKKTGLFKISLKMFKIRLNAVFSAKLNS